MRWLTIAERPGGTIRAVDYAGLVASPEEMLCGLFQQPGLPVPAG